MNIFERQRLLQEFIQMYGHRAKAPMDAYKAGEDPTPVLMVDVTPQGITPDMHLEALTVDQAAKKLDTSIITVRLFMNQVQRILSERLAGEQCAMCLRFSDGEVLSEVVKVKRVTGRR